MRQQVQNDRTAIRRCAQSSPKKKARRDIQQKSLNDPQLAKVIKAGLSKATARTFWGDGFITTILDKNVKKNARSMFNFRILPSKARFTQDTPPSPPKKQC